MAAASDLEVIKAHEQLWSDAHLLTFDDIDLEAPCDSVVTVGRPRPGDDQPQAITPPVATPIQDSDIASAHPKYVVRLSAQTCYADWLSKERLERIGESCARIKTGYWSDIDSERDLARQGLPSPLAHRIHGISGPPDLVDHLVAAEREHRPHDVLAIANTLGVADLL